MTGPLMFVLALSRLGLGLMRQGLASVAMCIPRPRQGPGLRSSLGRWRYLRAYRRMAKADENTGDRLTWRQAILLLVAAVAFIFISRAVYDYFDANAHLRPIETHAAGPD